MQLIRLEAENFKRIAAVAIDFPAAGVFEVCGKNEQGKSSAIDAIWAALGGKEASPDQPLRAGTLKGSSSVDLGDYKVIREWRADGVSRLVVTDANGGKVARPQEVLDGLWSRVAFDPLEFTRMTASQQAAALRRITGLDFGELERKRAKLATWRTDATRNQKRLEVEKQRYEGVEFVAPVDLKELNQRIFEANQHNRQVDKASDEASRRAVQAGEAAHRVEELERQLAAARRHFEECDGAHKAALAKLDGLPATIDTDPLFKASEEAQETNRKAQRYAEGVAKRAEWDEAVKVTRRVIDELDALDSEQAKMLAEAKFPVEGLSFTGDIITFRGVPFDQVSSSEKIRVSLGMAAAVNPKLRLAVIKDGSLLDDDKLALVAEWAAANQYQVLVERVANETRGVGVVIAEGRVKAPVAEPATA